MGILECRSLRAMDSGRHESCSYLTQKKARIDESWRITMLKAEAETTTLEERKTLRERLLAEDGAAGYIFLWFLGVPASVLFVIFLMRGCT